MCYLAMLAAGFMDKIRMDAFYTLDAFSQAASDQDGKATSSVRLVMGGFLHKAGPCLTHG